MEASGDSLQAKWHDVRDGVQRQWHKLTDEDIAGLSGKQTELVSALQQRYGYGKAQAQMEIDKWLRQLDAV